jgi:hypothetical protein
MFRFAYAFEQTTKHRHLPDSARALGPAQILDKSAVGLRRTKGPQMFALGSMPVLVGGAWQVVSVLTPARLLVRMRLACGSYLHEMPPHQLLGVRGQGNAPAGRAPWQQVRALIPMLQRAQGSMGHRMADVVRRFYRMGPNDKASRTPNCLPFSYSDLDAF